jgi:hypothetical protein
MPAKKTKKVIKKQSAQPPAALSVDEMENSLEPVSETRFYVQSNGITISAKGPRVPVKTKGRATLDLGGIKFGLDFFGG